MGCVLGQKHSFLYWPGYTHLLSLGLHSATTSPKKASLFHISFSCIRLCAFGGQEAGLGYLGPSRLT